MDIPFVIAKAVVDHTDGDKGDTFHAYGCELSAALLLISSCVAAPFIAVNETAGASEIQRRSDLIALLSPAARNRFFGSHYFDYSTRPGGPFANFRFFDLDKGEFWTNLVLAPFLAILTTRLLGIAWGESCGGYAVESHSTARQAAENIERDMAIEVLYSMGEAL
jgi:hypothetical protein